MHYSPECEEIVIEEEGLPGCCAIGVAYEADFNCPEMLSKAVKAMVDCDGDYADKGLYLYSLTTHQKKERAAVEAAGFEPLTEFVNPDTGNTITLYGKKINQPLKKAKRRS